MTQAITAQPLNFTKYTGIGSGGAGVAAAILASYEVFKKGDLSEPVLIGALGALGLAIVAVAIAAAGDTLARAYVTGRTSEVQIMGGTQVKPAVEAVATKLIEATKPAVEAGAAKAGAAAATALRETTKELTDAYIKAHVNKPGTTEAEPALSAAATKVAAVYEQRDTAANEASTTLNAIETIRRLAELRDQNMLTDEEFQQKKAELLGRI